LHALEAFIDKAFRSARYLYERKRLLTPGGDASGVPAG
jgi:hypothetical protein